VLAPARSPGEQLLAGFTGSSAGPRESRAGGTSAGRESRAAGGSAGPRESCAAPPAPAVLEALGDGVLVVGRDGRMLQANRAARAIIARHRPGGRAALHGDAEDWAACLTDARAGGPAPSEIAEAVLATGEAVRETRVELAGADGERLWLAVSYIPMRDEVGRIGWLLVTLRDVSADEGQRRDLLDMQLRLREAHEVARLASWEWRPASGEVLILSALGESEPLSGANATLEMLLGWLPEDLRADMRGDLDALARGEREESVRRHRYELPGGDAWLETRARAIRDAEGSLICVRGTSQDVTADELARLNVSRSRDFLQRTLDSLAARIAVLDGDGRIIMSNRAWAGFEGACTPQSSRWSGLTVCDTPAPSALAGSIEAGVRAVLSGERADYTVEYPCASQDGERWWMMKAVKFTGPGEARVVVSHQEVTERRRAQAESQANQRQLLAARNYMHAVSDSMGEGLFTADNEGRLTYMNRAATDLLGWSLPEVQGRMMHQLLAGEHPHAASLEEVESPIQRASREGIPVRVHDDVFIARDGRRIPVAYTAAPLEIEDRVEGCVVLLQDISERKLREQALRRDAESLAWIERVQDAITGERLLLYAQPIVDVRTRSTVQHELLLRVREPGGDVVAPGPYLETAERYGLIGEIDRWVIRNGIQIAAAGRPVELNVSARSIGDPTILDHVERCLRQSRADPALLVFEITETALADDELAARAFAQRLQDLGCRLALDDFGTGYGGFTYLKRLPVDYLKIDIEFVRDLCASEASRHVVEAVVGLARSFALRTVAEGVEDAQTLEQLAELGVDFAQGYHVGRPEPIALA